MNNELQVLIVEDDFRVAEINRRLVEEIPGFAVIQETKTAAETMRFLASTSQLPDMVLLDIYIPDSPGLELFRKIREHYPAVDIILLTAAKEVQTVQEALQGGIFDYLIKPVDFERFTQAFSRYRSQKAVLSSKQEVSQEDLDRMLYDKKSHAQSEIREGLPKGIDPITLATIKESLGTASANGLSAVDAACAAGVSRSTARRYLEYLVSAGQAEAKLQYGDVGRPERTYLLL